MIGSIFGAGQHTCGHCWHVVATGWDCCVCPERVKARQSPPEVGTAGCQAPPPAVEGITDWLAPAADTRRDRPRRAALRHRQRAS